MKWRFAETLESDNLISEFEERVWSRKNINSPAPLNHQ